MGYFESGDEKTWKISNGTRLAPNSRGNLKSHPMTWTAGIFEIFWVLWGATVHQFNFLDLHRFHSDWLSVSLTWDGKLEKKYGCIRNCLQNTSKYNVLSKTGLGGPGSGVWAVWGSGGIVNLWEPQGNPPGLPARPPDRWPPHLVLDKTLYFAGNFEYNHVFVQASHPISKKHWANLNDFDANREN